MKTDREQGVGPGLIAVAALLASQLACRPVVSVGWWEIIIFLGIAAIVVIPLLIRLYSWWVSLILRRRD